MFTNECISLTGIACTQALFLRGRSGSHKPSTKARDMLEGRSLRLCLALDEIAHLYCTLNNKIGCLKICRIIPPHDRVNKVVSLFWPQLFKCWIALSIGYITIHWITIRETNCTIHCIEIYMVDSAIHLLNNWGPVLFHSLSFHFSFALHYSHNDYFEMETD